MIDIIGEIRGYIATIRQREKILRLTEKIKELFRIKYITRKNKTLVKGLRDKADNMS